MEKFEDVNIEANIEAVSIDVEKARALDFCKIWPPTQSGLIILAKFVKNPALKGVIGVVIKIGNANYKRLGC